MNNSILCSYAHRICDGINLNRMKNRVKDAVHVDLAQHRRVCQTYCSLRSRLPDTRISQVSISSNIHNPILFTHISNNGPEIKMYSHMMLVDCIIARSHLASAVSSKLSLDMRNRYLQKIRDVSLKIVLTIRL